MPLDLGPYALSVFLVLTDETERVTWVALIMPSMFSFQVFESNVSGKVGRYSVRKAC